MNSDTHAWALAQFANADLPDARLNQRLVKVATQIAASPGDSLPDQTENWNDLRGAYNLFSHEHVTPDGIQAAHRAQTRQRCAMLPVALCIQDTSSIDFTHRRTLKNAGKIGTGEQYGFQQHTALCVTPEGDTLGLLAQRWYLRPEVPEGETRAERKARWNEGKVWAEMAESVGTIAGCRLIHVGDRGADISDFFRTCAKLGVGCVVRAKGDRRIVGGKTGEVAKLDSEHDSKDEPEIQLLWKTLQKRPECGRIEVDVSQQSSVMTARRRTARKATLSVRFAAITLTPGRGGTPIGLFAVYLREESADKAIKDGEPVEWMLLTSEPVANYEDAVRIAHFYMRRWTIEEFHRGLKEGCKLEQSQLSDAEDVMRLAAVFGVVTIRLLQLRDMARPGHPDAEDPKALRAWAPSIWIRMIAKLEKVSKETLTPRRFLLAIARKGGYLGRKGDGNPGWKCLWQGWITVYAMAAGFEIAVGE